MSKRAKLRKRIHVLKEIKNIVAAMKNLSLIEISKLNKLMVNQNKVVKTIEEAATDFMAFNPNFLPSFHDKSATTYIIVGTERGFCGNFNEMLIDYFAKMAGEEKLSGSTLILVGQKLAAKMADTKYVFESIGGANAVEEIPEVILNLIKLLTQSATKKMNFGNLVIIHNEETPNQSNAHSKAMRPFESFKEREISTFPFPPVLTLAKDEFVAEMLDQYLFALLHQLFYKSFMAENHQRLLHMEGAVQWLEKKGEQLIVDYNRFRQEEVIEEIEIILLSAKAVQG